MGDSTVSEFFCYTDTRYLTDKLLGNRTDTNQLYLERIINTVKMGVEMMKAMDMARNPLPDVAPEIPDLKKQSKIEPDEI